ncbi:MAG: two-component regulator propeller domain-containing protein [Bacteroidia bacterium]
MAKIFSRFLFILMAVLCFHYNGTAQSYYFKNYSVDDGLPFINVSTIFQDSKGNLWSGGYGGLSRFDGITFTNYTPKNGLMNHAVTCISEDNKGNLWIGTIKGINKLTGKVFKSYTTQQGIISNSIKAVLKDSDGNLWFGTDKGVSKLVDGAFVNYAIQDGLANDNINCLFEDNYCNVWLGTNKGLSVFNGKKITNYNLPSSNANETINSIAADFQNSIWVATNNGLYLFRNNKFTPHKAFVGKNVKSLVVGNSGELWVGTTTGLLKLENNKISTYTLHKNKNSELISSLFIDFENNLWIGTYAGLFKYRANPFVSFGIEDGLTDQFIYGILRDADKKLWVGTKSNGLFKFENNRFYQQKKIKAASINAIFENNDKRLWLGTNEGLIIYNGNEVVTHKDTSTVFKRSINCFYKDTKNNIWLGGIDEIYKFDGKNYTKYSIATNAQNIEVWTIIEDLNGTIWAGTYLGGLFKLNGNVFESYNSKIGFKSDSYLASIRDKQGTLYFGTMDGLLMFNPTDEQFTYFTETDGLNSDLVYSLTFGKTQNQIWVGTNQGLNRIDINEFKNNKQKVIIPFGKEEGFSGVECNSNGTWVDDDDVIWFGTVNGIIKYDPNKYIKNTEESKTSIRGFRLFYVDTMLLNNMHLSHDNNNITIYFSGVCLTNPAKVKYSHILEGFEKTWSPYSKERLVTYSNLPPGSYTFRLISANNEGLWNRASVDFKFTIDKPFWKRWWFITIVTLFVITSITLIVRLRIINIKNRERRKTELNKRIANIESQALRAQMNPHFIFNTLSSIQHYISNNNTDEALKYLSKFAKLMRKIMENSKQPMITVAEEVNALNLYLELEIMRFDKKFEYAIVIDSEIDQNYDRVPSMLIQPYIENAIVHGLLPKQGAGKITIELQKQHDTILCLIEDNGIGRENSKQFKKNRVAHKSMGMSITQERLDILNAGFNSNISCEITDLYDKGQPAGTKVRLIIPLEVGE